MGEYAGPLAFSNWKGVAWRHWLYEPMAWIGASNWDPYMTAVAVFHNQSICFFSHCDCTNHTVWKVLMWKCCFMQLVPSCNHCWAQEQSCMTLWSRTGHTIRQSRAFASGRGGVGNLCAKWSSLCFLLSSGAAQFWHKNLLPVQAGFGRRLGGQHPLVFSLRK